MLSPAPATHEHDLLFQSWASLIGDAGAIYLSGPITTGRRWVEEVSRHADPDRQAVIAANAQAIHAAAAALRAEGRGIVVEPASLVVANWSQADYLILWTGFIERHASQVMFLNDWAYSLGCVEEFAHATRMGIATLRLDDSILSAEAGLQEIAAAVHALRSAERPARDLHILADGLEVRASILE